MEVTKEEYQKAKEELIDEVERKKEAIYLTLADYNLIKAYKKNEDGTLKKINYKLPKDLKRFTQEDLDYFVDRYNKGLKKEVEIEAERKSNDLKTFIFNKDEIIQSKVFTSNLLNDTLFGFGLLLPRMEDIIEKKSGKVIGQHQKWRGVIITSEHRGFVVSQFFQTEYKVNYDNIPYEMKLRWELKDIDDFLHNPKQNKVDGKKLFDSIKKQYEHYLYFRSSEWYKIHSLWDLGTYVHQLFSAYPLFENRGLSGTAKTKTMLVSSYITLNATDIMTNPSEPTLFRETETLRPTKYIDEAEKLFKFTKDGMEADNRVELINASYVRNGSVPRQEKMGNKYYTKWYHVYSPSQISSINGLYGATETRAITQIHTKAPDNDPRGERDPEDDSNSIIWKDIRNNCYRWTLENWKVVYETYLNFNIKTELKKRDLQIWKPLLVLAKIIDEKGLLPEIITFAEKLSMQRKNDNISEGTLDYKYLNCLNYLILHSASDKIYVDDVRERFNITYGASEEKKNNKSISAHLDKLGFKDLRDRDERKSFFRITKPIFDEIVSPLTNDFQLTNLVKNNDIRRTEENSPSSPASPLLYSNINNNNGECMVNDGEDEIQEKIKNGEAVDNGENGDGYEQDTSKEEIDKIPIKPSNFFKSQYQFK